MGTLATPYPFPVIIMVCQFFEPSENGGVQKLVNYRKKGPPPPKAKDLVLVTKKKTNHDGKHVLGPSSFSLGGKGVY